MRIYKYYTALLDGKIVWVSDSEGMVDFFNVTSLIIFEAVKFEEKIFGRYDIRIATEKEKELIGTFNYKTEGQYLKQTKYKNHKHYSRDYSICDKKPCRYKDSSSVRFTPL